MIVFLTFLHYFAGQTRFLNKILAGEWNIQGREIIYEDFIDRNISYMINFRPKDHGSLYGDLQEMMPDGTTDHITIIRLGIFGPDNNLVNIYTGSVHYFYKLMSMQFVVSRDSLYIAQGKFVDETGNYIVSIYSPSRIDVTLYEKGKLSTYAMYKNTPKLAHLWMAKFFYFIPATIVLLIVLLLPWESQSSPTNEKQKID
ncbi:hypothetical protein TRFO_33316 [Tritrichomonas foetus]|uniref:Uncharacterized protein n=1 Tax=Tritrichomonas foetus TaxID=1144522 RepID=A0A1J4JLU6_9EUKA|nr:hypothetical protein TRFO_33316 [Tritrichomonas foetus]|eukprot:OHT00079.1 hypothetical protein TRFO_33316 [Tritrichomonas foetus]